VFIEAPVLGNQAVAEAAALNVLCACKNETEFESLKPILSCIGTPRYFGAVGTAAAAKISLNFLIGANLAAFSSSFAYLEKKNVNTDAFLTVLQNSPLNLSFYPVWAEKFKNRKYEPVMSSAGNLVKDIGLIKDQFKQAGVHTGAAESTYKLAHEAIDAHNQDKDITAVYETAFNPKKS